MSESFKNNEVNEVLDERWYGRFTELNYEDYEKLGGTKEVRELKKAEFMAAYTGNP